MKLSETVNAYIRPRSARWLAELSMAGMDADVLRGDPENRDSAPRGALNGWLQQRGTLTAARAFFVGQRIAADPRLAHCGDPSLALCAAGYLTIAASGLEAMINNALERYPNKSKVAKLGVTDWEHPVVRELTYAVISAAALPYALAHLDGIDDAIISPKTRADYLAAILRRSEPRFFDDAWTAHTSQQLTVPDTSQLTLADQQMLGWSAFVNRLSRRAQRDPILQLHFSLLRQSVDEYQRIVFAVPHHTPK